MQETIKKCRRVCLDHLETSSIFPLFLCNNRDQSSQQEADSIKHHVARKLRAYWPELDPDSQIIYISSPYATNDDTAVAEFASLMDAVKSTALQSNKATEVRSVMTMKDLEKLRGAIMASIYTLSDALF